MAADAARKQIQFQKKKRVRVRPLPIRVRSNLQTLVNISQMQETFVFHREVLTHVRDSNPLEFQSNRIRGITQHGLIKITTAGTAVYLQVVLRKTAVLAAHASHSGL